MAARRAYEIMDRVSYEVDDPQFTRFTTTPYYYAIEEAIRDVRREAENLNCDFLQYREGEKHTLWETIGQVLTTGNVSRPCDTGTAEDIAGGSTNELLDDDKNWVPDQWAGYTLALTTVAGTGSGQSFAIASNTYSTITIDGAWTTEPDSTTGYEIRPPENKIYDAGRGTPYRTDMWTDTYIRITSGTGVGQEREITNLNGYEVEIVEDWSTTPEEADTYEIVGVKRDFDLPSDFQGLQHVYVNGTEIFEHSVNRPMPTRYKPCWSIVGDYLRIDYLAAGDIVELVYTGADATIANTTAEVPYAEVFFDEIIYYISMKFKGRNQESIQNDAIFYGPIRTHMRRMMTDINMDSDEHLTSAYEDFPG